MGRTKVKNYTKKHIQKRKRTRRPAIKICPKCQTEYDTKVCPMCRRQRING